MRCIFVVDTLYPSGCSASSRYWVGAKPRVREATRGGADRNAGRNQGETKRHQAKQSPYLGMMLAGRANALAEPSASSRAALMTLPVVTRGDALAALSLLEDGEDHALIQRLIDSLRLFLEAA
jgi:hypothetical protein